MRTMPQVLDLSVWALYLRPTTIFTCLKGTLVTKPLSLLHHDERTRFSTTTMATAVSNNNDGR